MGRGGGQEVMFFDDEGVITLTDLGRTLYTTAMSWVSKGEKEFGENIAY